MAGNTIVTTSFFKKYYELSFFFSDSGKHPCDASLRVSITFYYFYLPKKETIVFKIFKSIIEEISEENKRDRERIEKISSLERELKELNSKVRGSINTIFS